MYSERHNSTRTKWWASRTLIKKTLDIPEININFLHLRHKMTRRYCSFITLRHVSRSGNLAGLVISWAKYLGGNVRPPCLPPSNIPDTCKRRCVHVQQDKQSFVILMFIGFIGETMLRTQKTTCSLEIALQIRMLLSRLVKYYFLLHTK